MSSKVHNDELYHKIPFTFREGFIENCIILSVLGFKFVFISQGSSEKELDPLSFGIRVRNSYVTPNATFGI